jgi:hypothetical protein
MAIGAALPLLGGDRRVDLWAAYLDRIRDALANALKQIRHTDLFG